MDHIGRITNISTLRQRSPRHSKLWLSLRRLACPRCLTRRRAAAAASYCCGMAISTPRSCSWTYFNTLPAFSASSIALAVGA